MPIYEYHCQNCGKQFEKFLRSSTNRDTVECPHCHSTCVQKAPSLFGMGGFSNGNIGLRSNPTPSCNTGHT